MTKTVVVSLAWLVVNGALYLSLLALDVYWNLADWKPKSDATSAALIAGVMAGLWAALLLSQHGNDHLARWSAILTCLFLTAAGASAAPPEPIVDGLFARQTASPWWYRGGRLFVLVLPACFLAVAWVRASRGGARLIQPGISEKLG